MTVGRKGLAKKLADILDMPDERAALILGILFDEIAIPRKFAKRAKRRIPGLIERELAKGNDVLLSGFGRFTRFVWRARALKSLLRTAAHRGGAGRVYTPEPDRSVSPSHAVQRNTRFSGAKCHGFRFRPRLAALAARGVHGWRPLPETCRERLAQGGSTVCPGSLVWSWDTPKTQVGVSEAICHEKRRFGPILALVRGGGNAWPRGG